MELNIGGHHFLLLKEKAVFWVERSTLLISDAHLGKIMHFRREGIAVPDIAFLQNFQQLEDLLFLTSADRIIFLGDLFHNTLNREWFFFSAWRKRFAQVRIQVVRGNHDILPDQLFTDLDIEMINGGFEQDGFLFTHHPLTDAIPGLFAFAGHIHPVFRLYAKGRQQLRLPCFVIDSYQAILPGFGVFTGGYEIDLIPGRSVFVVGGERIFQIEPPGAS